jgi:ABC-type lipoprotein export system ATPase subunit
VGNPSIVLADEPTGNLDSRTATEVIELFRKLNTDGGITVILVTHEQEVANHARRIVWLKDGEIVADTTTPGTGRPAAPPGQPNG